MLRRESENSATDREVAVARVIDRIERALAELDALGLTAAAANVSLGLDRLRSEAQGRGARSDEREAGEKS